METLKICGVKLGIKTIWCSAMPLVMSEVSCRAQPLSNKDHACYRLFDDLCIALVPQFSSNSRLKRPKVVAWH